MAHMNLSPVPAVAVGLDFGEGPIRVGRLAARDRRIYFEYDADFIANAVEILSVVETFGAGLAWR
jgi:serine/threonine-protein kinase HipA